MKMQSRSLNCFAERRDGVWLAFCVDLGLGAQGQSFEDAKQRLEAQLRDLSREEVRVLLEQGSPLSLRLRFSMLRAVYGGLRLLGGESRRKRRFREYLPAELLPC